MFGLGDRFDAARSAGDHWKRQLKSTGGVNRWNVLAAFLMVAGSAGAFMMQWWIVACGLAIGSLFALFMNKEVATTVIKVGVLLLFTAGLGAFGYWLGGLMGWPEAGAMVFVIVALFLGMRRID